MSKLMIKLPRSKFSDFCRRWKIAEFCIFGSALSGEFRPDSDVDVLVSFLPDSKASLFDMVRMQDELKNIFGRERYPQIPWREMSSLRNLVIHEYDVVDINRVWDTVQYQQPSLIEEISKIVPTE